MEENRGFGRGIARRVKWTGIPVSRCVCSCGTTYDSEIKPIRGGTVSRTGCPDCGSHMVKMATTVAGGTRGRRK